MLLACEVLLEFGKLGHAVAVFLKGWELGVGPAWATSLISTCDVRVLDTLEELEVSKGGLVATEERFISKMLDNGSQAFDSRVGAHFLVIGTESGSHDLIKNCVIDYREHLVGPSFFLRSAAEELWLILRGDVLLNSKGLGDRIFAINNVRKIREGDGARRLESFPFISTKHVALFLVGDAAVVEKVTSGVTSGTTTEVPVAKDDLTFFIGSVTTTPRYRRTTAHWFE